MSVKQNQHFSEKKHFVKVLWFFLNKRDRSNVKNILNTKDSLWFSVTKILAENPTHLSRNETSNLSSFSAINFTPCSNDSVYFFLQKSDSFNSQANWLVFYSNYSFSNVVRFPLKILNCRFWNIYWHFMYIQNLKRLIRRLYNSFNVGFGTGNLSSSM